MKPKVGFVYDELMAKHACKHDPKHPEGPHRITTPYRMLNDSGLLNECVHVESRLATDEELSLVHTKDYIAKVRTYAADDPNPCKLPERWPTYSSEAVFDASICAVGCVLNLVDSVCTNEVQNGVALVRPPGHHAEVDESCGFCFFNSLAIAAVHARKKHALDKILILDWDIHHGNGIQHIFYDDPHVLYVSLHRFDNGEYFPNLREANADATGTGEGEGFNVNIPWNKDLMGNCEYKAAFEKIVLPIAEQFKPDLVLVAAGFDAAAADPIGEYILTSDMYAYMTEKLLDLADGRVILTLEGGYNAEAIGDALVKCTEVLLGKSTVSGVKCDMPSKRAAQTIASVIQTQSQYWNLR